MKKIKECEICGNKEFLFLFEQNDKNLNLPQKFSLNKCLNCGLIFLNPQPSYKNLEKHYDPKKYYSLQKIIDKNGSKKVRIKLFLYNLYFNPKKNDFFLKMVFSPLKFFIRGTKIEEGKKLLDVGCGSGQFLYEMKGFGMNVWGVEPGNFNEIDSKKYELNIKKGDLRNAKYCSKNFNIITMNHVLEHINNPKETIKEIHRILKKDGTFIVAVPNSNSLAYHLFGKNWHQLDVPRHLFDFSNKNLKKLLEDSGFKIKKTRYNSRSGQFVVSLYFLLEIKKRRGIVNKILNLIFLPLVWIFNFLRTGDQIEFWCEKK